MLSENSILRHLPLSYEVQGRLKIEALVYAADILGLAHHRMMQVARHHFGNSERMPHADRVCLFSDAWSSVDQIQTAIQVIKSLGGTGPMTDAFCEKFACTRSVRNGMDHLVQNISNLSARRGFNPPIYGTLSYYEISPFNVVDDGNERTVTGADIVSISAGYPGSEGVAVSTLYMEGPFAPPVSGFVLWAFNWKFCLDKAVHDLNALLSRFSDLAFQQITKQAESEAERTGAKLSDVLAEPALAGIATRISVIFGHQSGRDPSPQLRTRAEVASSDEER